jgi:hypothetical protein
MEHANGGSLYEKLQRAPGKKYVQRSKYRICTQVIMHDVALYRVSEEQAADVVYQVCK